MNKAQQAAHLSKRKLELAEKYEGLIKASNSIPRKAKWRRLADKYRRQSQQYAGK